VCGDRRGGVEGEVDLISSPGSVESSLESSPMNSINSTGSQDKDSEGHGDRRFNRANERMAARDGELGRSQWRGGTSSGRCG
jgi:hypothetical protein